MLGCAGADEHVRSSKHSVICRSCGSSHIWPVAARPFAPAWTHGGGFTVPPAQPNGSETPLTVLDRLAFLHRPRGGGWRTVPSPRRK